MFRERNKANTGKRMTVQRWCHVHGVENQLIQKSQFASIVVQVLLWLLCLAEQDLILSFAAGEKYSDFP